jgi:hypothetical protein
VDYIVDLNGKTISYTNRSGFVGEKPREFQKKTDILFTLPFIQVVNKGEGNKKGDKTTSHLIVYKETYLKDISERENTMTLYIPHHGKSIISEYITDGRLFQAQKRDLSWVNMKFGKCVNTSN